MKQKIDLDVSPNFVKMEGWIGEQFRSDLRHSEAYQEIEARARSAFSDLVTLIGEVEARVAWPQFAPGSPGRPQGSTDSIRAHALLALYSAARRERPEIPERLLAGIVAKKIHERWPAELGSNAESIQKALKKAIKDSAENI